jgi:hypothetical protein
MHDVDPVFRRWSRSSKVAQLMAALGFRRPLPVQVGLLALSTPFQRGLLNRLGLDLAPPLPPPSCV